MGVLYWATITSILPDIIIQSLIYVLVSKWGFPVLEIDFIFMVIARSFLGMTYSKYKTVSL